MAHTVRDFMHTDLTMLESSASALDAAQRMREASIGDVLVTDSGRLRGIVTDRDLVVRCMANGEDPTQTPLERLVTEKLVTVSADDDYDEAVRLMKQEAVRRLPVMEGDRPVGIVSLGDLAVELDRQSALGGISAAPPNT